MGRRRLPLRPEGVCRCCERTLEEDVEEEGEGVTLRCRWCKDLLRVRGGSWEWAEPADPAEVRVEGGRRNPGGYGFGG